MGIVSVDFFSGERSLSHHRDNDVYLEADQFACELGEPVKLSICRSIFYGDVSSFRVAETPQFFPKYCFAPGLGDRGQEP